MPSPTRFPEAADVPDGGTWRNRIRTGETSCLLVLVGLIWGSAYPVIRFGIVDGATPVFFAASRYALSAVAIGLLAAVTRVARPTWRSLGVSGLLGLPIVGVYRSPPLPRRGVDVGQPRGDPHRGYAVPDGAVRAADPPRRVVRPLGGGRPCGRVRRSGDPRRPAPRRRALHDRLGPDRRSRSRRQRRVRDRPPAAVPPPRGDPLGRLGPVPDRDPVPPRGPSGGGAAPGVPPLHRDAVRPRLPRAPTIARRLLAVPSTCTTGSDRPGRTSSPT